MGWQKFITAGAVLIFCTGCWSAESKFAAACEKALKETLISPSSYKRISTVSAKEPMSVDDYFKTQPERSENVRALLKSANSTAWRYSLLVEYDASNSMGVLLRSKAVCTDEVLGDQPPTDNEMIVKVNGKTTTDRIVEQVKSLNRKK